MDARYSNWIIRWEAALAACERKGGDARTRKLVVRPPASLNAVQEVEHELGVALPEAFLQVLTGFSSGVNAYWYLPDDVEAPAELQEIFSGRCTWDLSEMLTISASFKLWQDRFTNLDDPYERTWHNKLAFADVPNGDYIALDLQHFPDAPVVYLSHDDDELHGWHLGHDFVDFVARLSLLGCAGSEWWQMRPFLPNAANGLDPSRENARKWREWFGLEFEVNKL